MTQMTKNLHLEHPEDLILEGVTSVLDWFASPSNISVKIDGAPAIVWGTNPENGKFFVSTKSVFNKKKVKICYTNDDILDQFDNQKLQTILHGCLEFLPRTEGIYQGDWIGYGGRSTYTPNTVTYDFPEPVEAAIIVAPHTVYTGDTLAGAVASPLTEVLESSDDVLFFQPTVDCTERFGGADMLSMLRSTVEKATFLSPKEAREVRIIINAFIREGKSISPHLLSEIIGDWELTVAYFQVIDLKEQMMEAMLIYDDHCASIGDDPILAEGFVRSNKYGTMKLVDRYEFARANFNNQKFRSN